jgi:hypothetical protein
MHPLRKLRESGHSTPAQLSALLADNVVFNSPILVRPIEGREVIAAAPFCLSNGLRCLPALRVDNIVDCVGGLFHLLL